jgi:hypothetical protein
MILCTPILTVFFLDFLTWRSYSHFVGVRYIIGGHIGRNVVYSGSLWCSLPYINNTPYLCFPFLGGWYTYSKSHVKCRSCVFTIAGGVISIKSFSATNEVCNLVSLRVKPFYIISSWLSYSWFSFSYFGCTGGIHIICWIICGRSSPWRSRDDI